MKTILSIPDKVFQEAERLARKTKRFRSRLFSDALKEYLERRSPDGLTDAMNVACSELNTKDRLLASAARRVLAQTEW
jgi:metal-responsive CopG/Arc/MetJ family transcriptional regulator